MFTSSGIKIDMKPEVMRGVSEAEIIVFRSNLLGFKVPFSSVDVRFAVEEGANLVEIINESSDGKLKLRSKGIEGEAVIGIYNIKSGMQITRVLVKILPRSTA